MRARTRLSQLLEMRDEIEGFNKRQSGRDLILKIGVHSGPSIAVTLNERLDYVGQTVNIAARVQALAGGGEICLTKEGHDASGVGALLGSYGIRSATARLKGVDEQTTVYRVGDVADRDDA